MCGALGLRPNGIIFPAIYQGLPAIRHRVKDSAGIVF